MSNALIVGGSNGIGMAITQVLLSKEYGKIYIIDKTQPAFAIDSQIISYIKYNFINEDLSVLNKIDDIDTLIITIGFGRVAPFNDLLDAEIINSFKVNCIAVIRIIKFFYNKIYSDRNFNCCIMGSIAGLVSSPLFSIYAATKSALCRFTESVNIELEYKGFSNRILNVCPGSIKGTKFSGGANDLNLTHVLAHEIILQMFNHNTLFIPQPEIFSGVIKQYKNDEHQYGIHSINYKLQKGRISTVPQVKIGYLSGTFDLFHIGHLNLLRRAKQYCDYLVVGVHKDASHKGKSTFIPFDERIEIVQNIKYVDRVIQSEPEDSDVYIKGIVKYDYLFVGSDYKGTERFNRYEKYFQDKDVKIIYFPYTQGTNSTQLRYLIENQLYCSKSL